MSNMSYCRFRNTLSDLEDCYENINDDSLDEGEARARIHLIQMCKDIASEWDDDDLEELEKKLEALENA